MNNQQMSFDFIADVKYSIGNFIVFNENIDAFYYLNKEFDDGIPENHVVFLSGERKCGKTHLGQIWKQKHNAKNINIREFYKVSFDKFIVKLNDLIDSFDYYVFDNFPADIAEDKFLFLLNTIITNNSNILIISECDFKDKTIKLKDLKSRIDASAHLKIAILSKDIKPMLINKLFADKQIFIDGSVLKYLNENLPTNYGIIFDFVENIFSNLNSSKRILNINFIKEQMGIENSLKVPDNTAKL